MADERPNDAIIRKIQMLLNLGNSKTANENEAALAMSRAQELLAKYNLDMAMIENAAAENGSTGSIKEKREKTTLDHSAMYRWQRDLCKAIAEANFCWHWVIDVLEEQERVSNGRSYRYQVKRHMILGKQSNVIAVTYMYGWLVDAIESMSPFKGSLRNGRSGKSWKEGCAARLMERIQEKAYHMQHPEQNSSHETQKYGVALRSLVQAEYEANYDALCGEGAYQRNVQAFNERQAQRKKSL